MTAANQKNIETVIDMLNAYKKILADAQQLRADGKPVEEVDVELAYSDGPAVAALAALSQL